MKPKITVTPADDCFVLSIKDAKGNSVELRCQRALIVEGDSVHALEGDEAGRASALLFDILPRLFKGS